MKPVFSIIAFLFASLMPLAAQEYQSLDEVAVGRNVARSRVVSYPTAELASQHCAEAVESQYLRTVSEWTRSEQSDATVFTAKYAIPFSWLSRLATLYVSEASGAYEVLINGKSVGYTSNAFSPAEFDVTKASKEDMNTIEIRIFKEHWSHRLEDNVTSRTPSVGEVYVMSQPQIRLRDVLHNARIDVGTLATVEVGMVVKTESLNPKKARIHYELMAPDTTVVTYGHRDIELGMRSEDTVKIMAQIPREALWSASSPTLYRLNLQTQIEGRYAEYQTHLIGFRVVESDEEGNLIINGEQVELNYMEADAHTISVTDIVSAREQGKNAVRFKMGAVPQQAYALCDSLGMYVYAQVPINTSKSGTSRVVGGNPSNDPLWREAYRDRVETTYRTTQNRTCVVGYVLAKDSANGISLYESYLHMKSLEKKRPVVYGEVAGEWNSD